VQQNQVDKMVAHLFREQAGKMIAALVNIFGFENLSVAEDVVQETFITAYQDWPYKGVPDDPAAWLFTVARNKAINVLKQNKRIQAVEHSAFLHDTHEIITQQVEHAFTKNEINDSQLKLLFMCCHPSLPVKSQTILTLQVL
jgi:RNA polymerase sigma-70 factor (ECF subfamily)